MSRHPVHLILNYDSVIFAAMAKISRIRGVLLHSLKKLDEEAYAGLMR